MKRVFLLAVLFTSVFMANIQVAFADGGPGDVYVDTSTTNAEDGSKDHPYNTEKEAIAYARSLPNGGYVYVKQSNGTYIKTYYEGVNSGNTGEPIPNFVLYTLLGILAVGLIVAGQYFIRKSRLAPV